MKEFPTENKQKENTMTNATATKETTYRIYIPITTTYTVEVTRTEEDGITNRDELFESITRDELANGDGELGWDDIKDAMRGDFNHFTIVDEDGDELMPLD